MALNLLMHPRNRYRNQRPDFKELVDKYEQFREVVKPDSKGKIHVDFRNPAHLRVLTWALLKDDFHLDVKLPVDRLTPTVPLRLNYILWLEDILGQSASRVKGIDIGTGAACIYPLLGVRNSGWEFIASEADPTNAEYAIENVTRNGLADKIRVIKVNEDATLRDVVCSEPADAATSVLPEFDFCMCNPPFYGSNLEAWGLLTTRGVGSDGQGNATRPRPSSVSTASPVESIVPGGEVQFVQQHIIESSLELKTRVRVYSTMLGKKSSLGALKDTLKMNGITNIGTTEFCQGRTMRWGLAWSFDDGVVFPKPVSKQVKEQKPRPPITYTLPSKYDSVRIVAEKMQEIFNELQIVFAVEESSEPKRTVDRQMWAIECPSNTWTHQRRKRREMMRQQQQQATNETPAESSTKMDRESDEQVVDDCSPPAKKQRVESSDESCAVKPSSSCDETALKSLDTCAADEHLPLDCMDNFFSPSYVLKCDVVIKRSNAGEIVLELTWVDGQNREFLHQLMQYMKNLFA